MIRPIEWVDPTSISDTQSTTNHHLTRNRVISQRLFQTIDHSHVSKVRYLQFDPSIVSMSTTTPIADIDIRHPSENDRRLWEQEMMRRQAWDAAYRFRCAICASNADVVVTMMEGDSDHLRRAIIEHDDPGTLLYLVYKRLGNELGKMFLTLVTEHYSWYGIGALLRQLLGYDSNHSLIDDVVTRYRELYVPFHEWYGEDGDGHTDEGFYPPSYLWGHAITAAHTNRSDVVDCLLPLVELGIEEIVAAGEAWCYQPLDESDAKFMFTDLYERLSAFYKAHIGKDDEG